MVKKKNCTVIIQARYASKRFEGKVLKKIKNLVSQVNAEGFIFNFIGICRSIKKDSDIELFSSLQNVKKKFLNIFYHSILSYLIAYLKPLIYQKNIMF